MIKKHQIYELISLLTLQAFLIPSISSGVSCLINDDLLATLSDSAIPLSA
jgi:hypothetical protein